MPQWTWENPAYSEFRIRSIAYPLCFLCLRGLLTLLCSVQMRGWVRGLHWHQVLHLPSLLLAGPSIPWQERVSDIYSCSGYFCSSRTWIINNKIKLVYWLFFCAIKHNRTLHKAYHNRIHVSLLICTSKPSLLTVANFEQTSTNYWSYHNNLNKG